MRFSLRNIVIVTSFLFFFITLFKCTPLEEKKSAKVSETNNEYKNLQANVHYVGIEKCKQCHYDKYKTFIETGMGKSFDKANKEKSSALFNKHSVIHDKINNLFYVPFWNNDSLKILEYRLEGKDTTYKRIETVNYIIGSGHHTNSHLFSTNGYLHQMPATFYTQLGKWDLPPGFENGYNSRFSR